jgi:hypothetical protein
VTTTTTEGLIMVSDTPMTDDQQEPTDASKAGAKALDKSYAETHSESAKAIVEARKAGRKRK